MSNASEKLLISRDDYSTGELVADRKNKYVPGQVDAMAGGKANNDTIAGNFGREAGNGLKGKPCRPFGKSPGRESIPRLLPSSELRRECSGQNRSGHQSGTLALTPGDEFGSLERFGNFFPDSLKIPIFPPLI